MKKHIRWTTSEERKVAIRAQAIRENPELAENRLATGHRCKSLPMCYRHAQEVLPAERRKHPGTFQQDKKLAERHAAILRSIKREEELAGAEAARKAQDAERERAARTPPAAPLDPLAPLKLMLGEVIAQAVAEGILRAAAALDIPIRQESTPGEHKSNGGNGSAGVAAVVQAMAARTHRTPVDVVGLKGGQQTIVQNSPVAAAFDIRFIPADSHMRNRDVREDVVICSKFVNHHTQNRYKAGHSRLHYANGGPQSVIEQLERLAQGNGEAAHH